MARPKKEDKKVEDLPGSVECLTLFIEQKGKVDAAEKEKVELSFSAIHTYLKNLLKEHKEQMGTDLEMRQGVEAVMQLVLSAEKLFPCPSASLLIQFYEKHYVARYGVEEGELIDEELLKEELGVQDNILEIIALRNDENYELLYILDEEGNAHFTENSLEHLKLEGQFDTLITSLEEEDPLLKIRWIRDRSLNASAENIYTNARPLIDAFSEQVKLLLKDPFVRVIKKMIISLLFSENKRNLIQNTSAKSCQSYFLNFHHALREALSIEGYLEAVSDLPANLEKWKVAALDLVHSFCYFFFVREDAGERISPLIQQMIKEGGRPKEELEPWERLLVSDEAIRTVLRKYPSGPIMKAYDTISEGLAKEGFDPLFQENIPVKLYTVLFGKKECDCLRIPSPTIQHTVAHVGVAPEFIGFLRFLAKPSEKQHLLMVNLQDRKALDAHTRSVVLEALSDQAEFKDQLTVVTLSKSGDFYEQRKESLHFKKDLLKDFVGGGGYHFPSSFDVNKLHAFAPFVIDLIEDVFFGGALHLNRTERQAFIEIFHQFVVLKIMDMVGPDGISFVCKDAVDLGMGQSALFHLFTAIIFDRFKWSQELDSKILWMLYYPALTVRERAIQKVVVERVSFVWKKLVHGMQENGEPLRSALPELFPSLVKEKFSIRD